MQPTRACVRLMHKGLQGFFGSAMQHTEFMNRNTTCVKHLIGITTNTIISAW